MSARKIRLLVADDSPLARAILKECIAQAEDMELVAEAENGREALEKNLSLQPDLIVMDLEMPVMGGLEAITEIMGTRAVPILVSSAVADAGNAYEAIRRGALDVVSKPDPSPESLKEFLSKIRILSGVPVISHIRPSKDSQGTMVKTAAPTASSASVTSLPAAHLSRIFAIASSTGGPQTLSRILQHLPADFRCPVVVAQHISDGFAEGMASWLASLCRVHVKLASDGEPLKPGVIYISPPEAHCVVTHNSRLALVAREEKDLYRPSCDRLLESVAHVYGPKAVGLILTGMGHDGVSGIHAILKAGGMTIAQNRESSMIYGMNRCAVEAGHIQKILHESEIAAEMIRLHGERP